MTAEEKAKVVAYCNELKEETKLAEKRAVFQKKKEIRQVSDWLWSLQNSLSDNIEARKTTMVSMENYLRWTKNCIQILKDAGLYTDPSE